MKDIEFFILVVLFVAVFVTLLLLWVRLRQNEEEVRLLHREVYNKVSETIFGYERDSRRQLRNELDALKEYLDVEVVEPENRIKMRSKK